MSRSWFASPRLYRSWRQLSAHSRRRCAPAIVSLQSPLFVLLDYPLEVFADFRNRLSRHLHLPTLPALDDDVELAVTRILLREIVAEVSTATLFSLQSGTSDDLGDGQQIPQIERRVPPRIVLAVSGHRNLLRPLS